MKHTRRNVVLAGIVGALLMAGATAVSGGPVKNVSTHRHPNLAAAQKLSKQAYDKLVAAQVANEWDMGGHAEKAKQLLEQVNNEIKLAAEAANQNSK